MQQTLQVPVAAKHLQGVGVKPASLLERREGVLPHKLFSLHLLLLLEEEEEEGEEVEM